MPHINNKPLIEKLEDIFSVLGPSGWGGFFRRFGFNIEKKGIELAKELTKPLNLPTSIYNQPQFTDLVPNIQRAIERGDPARSFLYHALASPAVIPDDIEPENYPTLADLEVIENYIYVAAQYEDIKENNIASVISSPSVQDIKDQFPGKEIAIVVFAQEYRQGDASVHRKHADMCFSRTGIARVGTTEANYDRKLRGFSPLDSSAGGANNIRVLPVQYGAYIAVLLKPEEKSHPNTFGPLGRDDDTAVEGDYQRSFWVPVHKLFSGPECLKNNAHQSLILEVTYSAHHVNEKIKRFHQFLKENKIETEYKTGDLSGDLEAPPARITDGLIDNLSQFQQNEENTCLIKPSPRPLVQKTDYSFKVPTQGKNNALIKLYQSSLEVRNRSGYRSAPEYVHIRHDVDQGNLNDKKNMKQFLQQEDRHAYHYTDATAEGWITVTVEGIDDFSVYPAYSLVAAPDFYPQVNQYDLQRWVFSKQNKGYWQTPPKESIYPESDPLALSQQRLPANLQLKEEDGSKVFNRPHGKDTATALVTIAGDRGDLIQSRVPLQMFGFNIELGDRILTSQVVRHQGLPDAAAGYFAPGWDVSRDYDPELKEIHFAAYGLGSPFPEDSKLCAALSAFWPASAPDTTRTFMQEIKTARTDRRTIVPMTNIEIGSELPGDNHPNPWDGVKGPTVSQNNNQYSFLSPNFFFADYTMNASAGKFSLALTSQVSTVDYMLRMKAMHAARGYILENPLKVGGKLNINFKLISFEINKQNNEYYFHFGTLGDQTKAPVEAGGHRFFTQPLTAPFTLIIHINDNMAGEIEYRRQLVRPDVLTPHV